MARKRNRLDPSAIRAWQRIIRDACSTCVGVFLCVFGAIHVSDPTALTIILGAGLTLLGLAPALRLDERLRQRENGNDEDDRWSHLP